MEKTAKTKLLGNSRGRGIVAKTLGIGLGNAAEEPVMTEERAQSGGSHGLPSAVALQ